MESPVDTERLKWTLANNMQRLLTAVALATSASACSLFTAEKSLSPEAHVQRVGAVCQLTVNGSFPAVHTLSPGDQRYPMEALIQVPNLKGPFRAGEVKVMLHGQRNDPYEIRHLTGDMTFTAESVSIAFEQHQATNDRKAFPFNGTYKLTGKEACAFQQR